MHMMHAMDCLLKIQTLTCHNDVLKFLQQSAFFRFLVLPVPASPIFSLQIDPLPASSTLEDNPIMMVFDVVR